MKSGLLSRRDNSSSHPGFGKGVEFRMPEPQHVRTRRIPLPTPAWLSDYTAVKYQKILGIKTRECSSIKESMLLRGIMYHWMNETKKYLTHLTQSPPSQARAVGD
ncbi:predicted protein [Histoplasma capsulatum G186AR]|uniref:Uncharacterized protein n=1 Tax=Ajellomyces capsulatus (strain G186AR / H82 / ATCC MYA-2454 / RMSCC 2432) TaxID=447093 RepID=C0NFJ0_AJECG|nr:uncharacterized protein HCBG_01656 [Histoplasma capsulatum G186AR]EEH10011.1 predicted protein [Histoplasma capsulatum G186AR]